MDYSRKLFVFLNIIRFSAKFDNIFTPDPPYLPTGMYKLAYFRSGSDWAAAFIALDYTLDRLSKEDTINVLGVTSAMRTQRVLMVQVSKGDMNQFRFCP